MKPIALAVIGMGVMAPAMAFEAVEFDNGAVFDADAAAGVRVSAQRLREPRYWHGR